MSITPRDVEITLALETQQCLTAVDAVQMAFAKGIGGGVVFVSSDQRLNRVARENWLNVLNPADRP